MPGSSAAGTTTATCADSVARRGLPEQQRAILWSIFEQVRERLAQEGSGHGVRDVRAARRSSLARRRRPPYDFVVVDEAQDMGVAHLRFFAALARRSSERSVLRRGPRAAHLPAAVLVAGARRGHPRSVAEPPRQLPHLTPDPTERRSSPRSGADRRGRQRREPRRHDLRVQRRSANDPGARRRETPKSRRSPTGSRSLAADGLAPEEFGVFVRSEAEIERAVRAVGSGRSPARLLDEKVQTDARARCP